MKSRLGLISLTVLSSVAFSAIAAKAAEPTAQAAQNAPPEPAAPQNDADLDEVVVTGSRVITNGNDSPTPVTVFTLSEMQAAHPETAFQSLLDLPQFAGSKGGFSSNPSGNQASSNQISSLNLRGLGPVRTLVLFDGHRVGSTEQDGLVDANIIPQMLLSRVDVVTGGASAIYGSDAVSGVVNYVTDPKFNGLKFEARGGVSQLADAGQYDIGIAYGTELAGGRAHIEGSYEHIQNDGILHRDERSQFQQNWTVQGNGCPNGAGSANCVPFFLTGNALNSAYAYGGKITGPATNPLLNQQFVSNGMLGPFVNGSVVGLPTGSTIQLGGSGIADTSSSLIPSQTLDQFFSRFDFDITDKLKYFLSFAASSDKEFNYYGNVNSQNLTISATNAFLPTAYQQQLAAAGLSTFTFSKKFGPDSDVPPSNVNNNTRNYYVNTGLEGKFDKYKWEASYTHQSTTLDTFSNYTFNNGRYFAALDAVTNPANGQIVCRVTLTNPGLYPGCTPINIFGPNSESQAAINYVQQISEFVQTSTQDNFEANVSGSPVELWAGPVKVAVSAEWHRQAFNLTSTAPTIDSAPLSCTGLVYNCSGATASSLGTPAYNGAVAPRPNVSMTVAEGAVETDVPLLADVPFAQAVDADLAYRYAKYSAVGNPNIAAPAITDKFQARTWKTGLDWQVDEQVTLRAARSEDIRAPNLNDLFQTNQVTFSNSFTDLLTSSNLTGAGALVQIQSGGNPNLKPETATTSTLGVVVTPIPSLTLAVDAFDISIKNYIATLAGYTAAIQNGCYAGNAFDCSLQVRPGGLTNTSKANAATRWLTIPVNSSQLSTKGLDFEANYSTKLFSRALALRAITTYQPHIYYLQPGQIRQDYAGALGVPATFAPVPTTRVTVFAHYKVTDDVSFDWETKWRSGFHQSPDPTLTSLASANAPSVSFSNLTVSYDLSVPYSGDAVVYLNVSNVFDTAAPIAANFTASGSPGLQGGFVPGDDPTGRYFEIGFRMKW